MSFRDKVSKLGKSETKVEVEFPNVEEEESKTASKMESKREPKYLFLGFFVHGGYGVDAQPYKANKHASVSIRTFESVPKLMTFMSCTPGNSLIGEEGGLDNIRLSNYFKHYGKRDLLDISNFGLQPNKKSYDKLLANIFFDYVGSALKEKLEVYPRDRTEKFKLLNPTDIDVCRNSYICDGKVGISNRFPNKSFDTNNKPAYTSKRSWGIFIYNNNCGVEPLTNIGDIPQIKKHAIIGKNGEIDGYTFNLLDIIEGLTEAFQLTDEDYLFLFDYSCSNFGKSSINQQSSLRTLRSLGRSVTSDLGFGLKSTFKKSRTKRGKSSAKRRAKSTFPYKVVKSRAKAKRRAKGRAKRRKTIKKLVPLPIFP